MARVPYLARTDARPDTERVWERVETERKMPTANLFLALANAPELLDAFLSYANALRDRSSLDPKLRELAILTVGHATSSEYEIAHHQSHAANAGVTPEQLERIADFETSELFGPAERAVMRLALDSTRNVAVSDQAVGRCSPLPLDRRVGRVDAHDRLVQLRRSDHGPAGYRARTVVCRRGDTRGFLMEVDMTGVATFDSLKPAAGGTTQMRAARLHAVGEPMSIDVIDIPKPRPTDVLVRVKACGIVPNMANVIANWPTWFPHQPLPALPAIFGLDATGVVEEVGEAVIRTQRGDRVYVNPLRSCGSCLACRGGNLSHCRYFTLNGYFSTNPDGQRIFDLYPYGGFCEYMTAPQQSLVILPENIQFEQAARFGYIGTAYHSLRLADAGPGTIGLIDGITGTLGVAATHLCLALGVARIIGTGRSQELLDRVKALAPDRIEVLNLADGSSSDRARSLTNDEGVDFVISALGARAPVETMLDSMRSVRRGGKVVNIGGVADELPIDMKWLMDEQVQLIGSNWFSTAQGQELAHMVETSTLDLSYLEHERFALADVNKAISSLKDRRGGFSNYVVIP